MRFFKKIQDWILKSEIIRKRILRFFTQQINSRSFGSRCLKGAEESTPRVNSSVPLIRPWNHANGIKKNIKSKGCRCGIAKKCKGSDASNKSCRDGVRKSRCPCVASGTGCSELCRCVNCGNIYSGSYCYRINKQSKKTTKAISFPLQKENRKELHVS